MALSRNHLRKNDIIQVLWNFLVSSEPVKEIDARRKVRGAQKWVYAEVLSLQKNGPTVIRYSSTCDIPNAEFKVRPRGDILEHFEECTSVLFRDSFSPFSCHWRSTGLSSGHRHKKQRHSYSQGSLECSSSEHSYNEHIAQRWCDAFDRIDKLESFVFARSQMFSELLGRADKNIIAERVLRELRDRLFRVAQRSVLVPRRRKFATEDENVPLRSILHHYTGVLSVDAPCTLEEFESVSQSVRRKVQSAEFDPPFELTQHPSCKLQCPIISFCSLRDICCCLGIESVSDRIGLLHKEKKATKKSLTPFLRIAGSLLLDYLPKEEDDSLPFVFVPGFGSGDCGETGILQTLFRKSSKFDHRNCEYKDPLSLIERSTKDAKLLYQQADLSTYSDQSENDIYDDVFSFRWRKKCGLSKAWSTEAHSVEHVSGTLQVYLPYNIVHGKAVVAELLSLLTPEVLCRIVSSS